MLLSSEHLRNRCGAKIAKQQRGAAMNSHCLLAFVLLLTPTAATSQRYGRSYSLADNPQLILKIKVEKERRYFRISDLRKMQRSTVIVADPVTETGHVYEGVALEQLVPNTASSSQGESIEILFGVDKTLTLAGNDLDPQTKVVPRALHKHHGVHST
jgi:hypothetical protein